MFRCSSALLAQQPQCISLLPSYFVGGTLLDSEIDKKINFLLSAQNYWGFWSLSIDRYSGNCRMQSLGNPICYRPRPAIELTLPKRLKTVGVFPLT